MKTIYLHILIAMCIASLHSPISAQDCDKRISTNPHAPFNQHDFPSNRYNPWLNTDFDIGATIDQNVPEMLLNNQIAWQISDFIFGSEFGMDNPYTTAGTPGDRYSYLHPSGVDFKDLDYKWSDGWEVLHIGLGYYPNGEEVQTASPTRAYALGVTSSSNPRVPYIIFYNRYRGTLRIFLNLFTPFDGYNDIRVRVEFNDAQSGLSGVLRHLESYDRALDQTTNVKRHESYNPNSGGTKRWFSADFQMAYDPCICGKNQKWLISLRGIETFNLTLKGRGVAVELPISDENGNPDYDIDWLSSNGLQDDLTGGNQIFMKFDGLINEYKAAIDKYNANSQTYSNLLDEFKDFQDRKEILDGLKGIVVDGAQGLIPAGGTFKSWFIKPTGTNGDNYSFLNFIKGSGKGLLGYGYDQLSTTINPKLTPPTKPVKPDMPVASYSEMRFEGSIIGTSQDETIGPFFIPGSYDEQSLLTNLTPFNYPSYNAPTGLTALLRTPDPLIFTSSTLPLAEPVPSDFYASEIDFRLRFEQPLEIAMNPSLDFNFDLTTSYFGIEVVLERENIERYAYTIEEFVNHDEYNNMTVTRMFSDENIESIQLNSRWLSLENLNQYCFSFRLRDHFSSDNPWAIIPADFPEIFRYKVKSVKVKHLLDAYFDQPGSDGAPINTLQVFTYLIHDLAAGPNLPLVLEGFYSPQPEPQGVFDQFIPGIITLGNEIISTTHPFTHHVDGNEIFINAQEVHITGALQVQQGYTVVIQATEQIQQSPDASFNPNIHMRIKKDFYGTPAFEYVDNNAVASFCNNSGSYMANVASKSLQVRIQQEIAENAQKEPDVAKTSETTLTLHPNPARSELTIKTQGAGLDQLTIYDMSTRPVIQASPGGQTLYRMDIGALSPGVYIVKGSCGDKVLTEKLVVAK